MIKKLPSKMIKWPNGNETEEYFTNADKVAKKLNEVIEAVNRLEQIHDPEFIRKSSIDPGFYKSI